MATANLNSDVNQVDFSNDSIVIVKNLETIPGGRTLDITGFTPTVIKAGHVIIEETANGELKPLPVDMILPALHTYKGVLVASILTAKPFAAVMVRGTVNKLATPYAIAAAVETALPLIRFTND